MNNQVAWEATNQEMNINYRGDDSGSQEQSMISRNQNTMKSQMIEPNGEVRKHRTNR